MATFLKNHICALVFFVHAWLVHSAAGECQGVLEQYESEITDRVVHAARIKYADVFREKSQEELNESLAQVSSEVAFDRVKVIALVEAGADPNYRNRFSSSVLLTAIAKDDKSLVRFLSEHKADLNMPDNVDMFAFWGCKSISMLDLCVSFGADVTKINRDGQNILHYVRPENKSSPLFVEHLFKLGASVKQVDYYGYTPLARLALHGQIDSEIAAKKFKETALLFLAFGVATEYQFTDTGYVGSRVADILRKRSKRLFEREISKKACIELANMIDRYPFRSLQELIIRNAILDARATDPLIAEPAQELLILLEKSGTPLHVHNKDILDRCFYELGPSSMAKIK